jgi:starch synthase (maltosyl-transferring)
MAKRAEAPKKRDTGKEKPTPPARRNVPPDPGLAALAADRVAIENVTPEIDGGRFPAKAAIGDSLAVEADIFCDGHDKIDAALLIRPAGSDAWTEIAMAFFDNDRWRGVVPIEATGRFRYTIIAWRDLFASWRDEVSKKHAAGVSISLELREGRELVAATMAKDNIRPGKADRRALAQLLVKLDATDDEGTSLGALMALDTAELMRRAGIRTNLSRYGRELDLVVDRKLAAFSAWYELFPRSMSNDAARHGTFNDVIAHLPYVRDLGFDELYFPPIHPNGSSFRKGKNKT